MTRLTVFFFIKKGAWDKGTAAVVKAPPQSSLLAAAAKGSAAAAAAGASTNTDSTTTASNALNNSKSSTTLSNSPTNNNQQKQGVWGKGPAAAVKAPPPSSLLQAVAKGKEATGSNTNRGNTTAHSTTSASSRLAPGRHNNHNNHVHFATNNKHGGSPKSQTSATSSSKNHAKQQDHSKQQSSSKPLSSKSLDDIVLLETDTTVQRVSLASFFNCRMQYLEPPPSSQFKLHKLFSWDNDANRLAHIEAEMDSLWNFTPLQVNDETRWKAKVMMTNNSDDDKDKNQLRETFAILNKLSWTNFDKLTLQFLRALGISGENQVVVSPPVLSEIFQLIVTKAMAEPHFADLYARFCSKLCSVHKLFKKTLLSLCQTLFQETAASEDRKQSIGLMQFLGELYQVNIIKANIMVECLSGLLKAGDEERLECFCKLMTTIGSRLQDNPELVPMWAQVDTIIATGGASRIKFLLQDLLDLKDNGWVARRKEEKAKTLKEIHKDVAQEEMETSRRGSTVSLRKPIVSRAMMAVAIPAEPQDAVTDDQGFQQVTKPKRGSARRVDGAAPKSSLQAALSGTGPAARPKAGRSAVSSQPPPMTTTLPVVEQYLAPEEFEGKATSMFKDYFISEDIDDALLTIGELIDVERDGHTDRGTALVAASLLLIMEMKKQEATKLVTLMRRCIKEEKLSNESLVKGIYQSLDSLREIQTDAPHADKLLAIVLADWLTLGAISLDVFKHASANFLNGGRPAEFACRVLASRESANDVSADEVALVQGLMDDEDKGDHPSVADWVQSMK
jgi:hypothetical protein